MDELIKSLTPQQIEAAYRHQKMLYRINDAEAHLLEAADIRDWDDTIALAQFEEEYGIPFSRLTDPEDELYALETIATQFINKYDCNSAENDLFACICEEYLYDLFWKLNHERSKKKTYRAIFSRFGFADVEAANETEATEFANNLPKSDISWSSDWKVTGCEECDD